MARAPQGFNVFNTAGQTSRVKILGVALGHLRVDFFTNPRASKKGPAVNGNLVGCDTYIYIYIFIHIGSTPQDAIVANKGLFMGIPGGDCEGWIQPIS